MRRGRWILLAAVPVALLFGDIVYWRLAVRQLERGYHQWVTETVRLGWTVTADGIETGGWPMAATLTLRNAAVHGPLPDLPDGVRWRAEGLEMRLALLSPRTLDIAAHGRQQLRVGDQPAIDITADALNAVLPLRPDEPPDSIDLQASQLTARQGGADATTIGLLRGRAALAPQAAEGEPAIDFTLSAEAIRLPASRSWALGSIISSLAIEGVIHGPWPASGGLAARAAGWRDGGGSLEIQHFALGWGPLGLSATATLALDDQLQPMGAGNSHIVGYAAALDALSAKGLLSRSAATAAKAVLSLLAGTPADGEPATVDVPLTLQYRTLSMRQVPLVRLPELDWPTR
jgi:hypothetical protein